MNKLLAALAITVALTGAANATKFDTSKMTVDAKSALIARIAEYTERCDASVWPMIEELHTQLRSEVDPESDSMIAAKKAVDEHRPYESKLSWCGSNKNYLQQLNDKLPPPPPPPPPPVDLADTAEGRAAFHYVSVQRHATVCSMARSQAFEMARKAMLARAGKDIDPQVMIWAGNKFDQEVGPMIAAGFSGQWCREMTATITTYQRMMFE